MTSKAKHFTTGFSGISLLFFFLFWTNVGWANADQQHDNDQPKETVESGHSKRPAFDAGDMVMHHIKDAHDWHLFDWDEEPVAIPLPIIIYQKDRGLSIFLSNKFEHGHASYNGYKLDHNKIVAVDGLGEPDKEATAKIWDLSITKNIASLLISIAILLWLFISIAKSYAKKGKEKPKGLQSALEPIIMFVRDDIARAAIGEKHYKRFLPYLLTLFFFIWLNNILGLIPIFPGGANLTGNIAVPLVMACFTLVITLFVANKHYWRHIFAMPGVPIFVLPIITLLEVIGIVLKPFVLMVRLFANITAGHIVLLVFFSLIFIAGEASAVGGFLAAVPAILFTVFVNCLELLVGFLQAFVFTFLSAIYFGMATAEEH